MVERVEAESTRSDRSFLAGACGPEPGPPDSVVDYDLAFDKTKLETYIRHVVRADAAVLKTAQTYQATYYDNDFRTRAIQAAVEILRPAFPDIRPWRSDADFTSLRQIKTPCYPFFYNTNGAGLRFGMREFGKINRLNPQAIVMLAIGQLNEAQWVAWGLGLVQVSHLCANTICATPYHAEMETPGANGRRRPCLMLAQCIERPVCRRYAFKPHAVNLATFDGMPEDVKEQMSRIVR
ncbi:hypothetical protein LTR17_005880 [Elasticomyces elasticus]|nr:hypothetical protein LTR17_005880 [Elasticomyces elasticus]